MRLKATISPFKYRNHILSVLNLVPNHTSHKITSNPSNLWDSPAISDTAVISLTIPPHIQHPIPPRRKLTPPQSTSVYPTARKDPRIHGLHISHSPIVAPISFLPPSAAPRFCYSPCSSAWQILVSMSSAPYTHLDFRILMILKT